MNLDELQSVQARERQSSDLQHLRSSFYKEVGEFISELNEERARAVEAADDPFSEPEVRRLTDDIETAEGTVEAIYERRVGKVVKKASIAAAGMPIEDDGLTAEEEALFEDLVDRIEKNRETVLSVLDGEAPSVSCSIDEDDDTDDRIHAATEPGIDRPSTETDSAPDPPSVNDDGVSAADLMGGSGETDRADAIASADEGPGPPTDGRELEPSSLESNAKAHANADDPARRSAEVPASDPDARPRATGPETSEETPGIGPDETASTESSEQGNPEIPGIPRTTVRITADVGEIVGADDRDYDLDHEDVVTLPEPNADVLVEKNAAERLDRDGT